MKRKTGRLLVLCDGVSEPIHGLLDGFFAVVDSGASDKQVRPCLHHLRNGSLVNTTINFDIALQTQLGDLVA